MRNPASILIVRLGAMGDVLHAMPAVAALREALPDSHFGWIIERRWAELVQGATIPGGRSLVDELHLVDTRTWRKAPFLAETRAQFSAFRKSLRARHYELMLDFQGAIKSALLGRLSSSRRRLGFATPREQLAASWYTEWVRPTTAHIIDQNLELASASVGHPLTAGSFDLPHSVAAEQWCDRLLADAGAQPVTILNPGSGWGAKCWPVERYAELAQRLGRLGHLSVVNHGPGEQESAKQVVEASQGNARAILCSLSELIALTRRCALFVGGDTGPLHLAAALRVPVLGLYGPTDPARNGPYGTVSTVLRNPRSVTSYRHVSTPDAGLHAITVEQAFAAAAKLLEAQHG